MADEKTNGNESHRWAALKKKTGEMYDRANKAVDDLIERNEAITFLSVSEDAKVSKSWLYRHPDIRARIEKERGAQRPRPPAQEPVQRKNSRGIGEYDPEEEAFTFKIPRSIGEGEKHEEEEGSDFLKLIWRENELVLILKRWPGRK